jgi:hypothetical protein
MSPEQIRARLDSFIYILLDMQGYMPTPEMDEELRQVRYNVIDLQHKFIEHTCDNQNKLI